MQDATGMNSQNHEAFPNIQAKTTIYLNKMASYTKYKNITTRMLTRKQNRGQ